MATWNDEERRWEVSVKALEPGVRNYVVTGIEDYIYGLKSFVDEVGPVLVEFLPMETSEGNATATPSSPPPQPNQTQSQTDICYLTLPVTLIVATVIILILVKKIRF